MSQVQCPFSHVFVVHSIIASSLHVTLPSSILTHLVFTSTISLFFTPSYHKFCKIQPLYCKSLMASYFRRGNLSTKWTNLVRILLRMGSGIPLFYPQVMQHPTPLFCKNLMASYQSRNMAAQFVWFVLGSSILALYLYELYLLFGV